MSSKTINTITVDVINPDGSLDSTCTVTNSMKTDLFKEIDRMTDYLNLHVNTAGLGLGMQRLSIPRFMGHAPVSIALLHDDSETITAGYNIDEGDLIGYWNITEANGDSSNPVQGNKLDSSSHRGIDETTGNIYWRMVGEFGSAQLNGTFNKIGFVGDHSSFEHMSNVHVLTDKLSPAYITANSLSPNASEQESTITPTKPVKESEYLGNAASFMIDGYTSGVPGAPYDNSSYTTTNSATHHHRFNLSCCADGHFFTVGSSHAYDSSTDIEIFNISAGIEGNYDDNNLLTPIAILTPNSELTTSTGTLSMAYDSVNEVMYLLNAETGSSIINITPIVKGPSGWTVGSVFNLTVSVEVDVDTGYLAACFNEDATEINIVYNEAGFYIRRVVASISTTEATEISSMSMELFYSTYKHRVNEVSLVDGDVLMISGTKSAHVAGLCTTKPASSSSNSFVGKNIYYADFSNGKFSYSAGLNPATTRDDGFNDNESPFNSYPDASYTNQALTRGMRGNAYLYGLCHIQMDSVTKDLNMVSSEALTEESPIIYSRIPYTPLSSCALMSSALTGEITKVEGQTMKVTYTLTTSK